MKLIYTFREFQHFKFDIFQRDFILLTRPLLKQSLCNGCSESSAIAFRRRMLSEVALKRTEIFFLM